MPEKLPKIIFIGTAEFGIPVLESLIANNYQIPAVITTPDKPVGRQQILTPPPIKKTADRFSLPCWQPKKITDIEEKLKALKPDIILVVAYGQILPKQILNIPKNGCLNIHGSLLPKYRGPSPIQTAILDSEKETGVTLMLMDEKIDHGPIIAQDKLEIKPDETAQTLYNRLADLAAELFIKSLPKYLAGQIKPQLQDESKVTYTKILFKEDGRIDLNKTAQEIARQIRAFDPWPGTWTELYNKRIKILKAKVVKKPDNQALKTNQDYLLPEIVQPAGKNPMSWSDFLRGNK